MNTYLVLKQFEDPVEGKKAVGSIVRLSADRGAKLVKMGIVSLQAEYKEDQVQLRWVNEALEVYNVLTGIVLLRIPKTGIASLPVDIVGNVTGNVTGNVNGNLTGNVNGNLTGNVNGNLTGNVNGNLTGLALGAVNTYVTDGVIAITDKMALLDGAVATCVMTLGDGVEGQEIIIKVIDVTSVCSVAPTNLADGALITFTDQYSAVRLVFDGTDWNVADIYLTVAVT